MLKPLGNLILAFGQNDLNEDSNSMQIRYCHCSQFGTNFLIWDKVTYLGQSFLFGTKFLIWDKVTYLGQSSLFGAITLNLFRVEISNV